MYIKNTFNYNKCKITYAVLIIYTAPELMKLIFAVLDVSLTMGLTRCYITEGFFTFIFAVFVHISRYFY